jgi:hypothetical protein
MGVIVNLLSMAVLVANLLVPQRVVSYNPCCYSEDGTLASCLPPPETRIGDNCCDPIVKVLRHSAPAQTVRVAPQKAERVWLSAAPPAFVSPVALVPTELAVAKGLQATGPPGASAVLEHHSRLNL